MRIDCRENGMVKLGNQTVAELTEQFGSPLYVYDEKTLRERCRQLKSLCTLPNFHIAYSAKANTSIALMKIIREEGIGVDAMTLGEIYLEKLAGYQNHEILFLSNNVSHADFEEVQKQGVKVCIDSLTQLERYCSIAKGGEAYIRLNPEKGAGHHEKVVTAGKVKFGIEWNLAEEAVQIAKKYDVKITGFTIHIGSLFLESDVFHESVEKLLDLVKKYPDVEYVDFGGGIGIPYNRDNEGVFPFEDYSKKFTETLQNWMNETGRTPTFAIEPGRFVVAECGVTLATVQSTKVNGGIHFVGTDLGFNFLVRPEMYGSYHEVVHASNDSKELEKVTVVGNVCESGDILGKDRLLPKIEIEDTLLVRDTGAYGLSMASNYNSMLRPAEVLIQEDGTAKLIRKRESQEALMQNQIF